MSMTYEKFLNLVDQAYNQFNWRYGQSLMNVLHGVWPEKYKEIVESDYDVYYNESNVPKVLKKIQENWKNK
jgi:hypothetical protein